MPGGYDQNDQLAVVDFVDDTVIADPQPESVPAGESFDIYAVTAIWVVTQQGEGHQQA